MDELRTPLTGPVVWTEEQKEHYWSLSGKARTKYARQLLCEERTRKDNWIREHQMCMIPTSFNN